MWKLEHVYTYIIRLRTILNRINSTLCTPLLINHIINKIIIEVTNTHETIHAYNVRFTNQSRTNQPIDLYEVLRV